VVGYQWSVASRRLSVVSRQWFSLAQALTPAETLAGDPITDAGLAHLRALTELTLLGVNQTHIGDQGLINLKSLTHLESLRIENTKVTIAGLEHLRHLTKLNHPVLGPNFTKSDLAELHRQLPGCSIHIAAPDGSEK
jgi:hypothetical protein